MTSPAAIRHVASSTKSALRYIHLQCHVKFGASKQREGIISISDRVIEVCVFAQPRDGEANKAVREVLSQILKCPKSDVQVIRGLKSRDKTIAVAGIDTKGDEKSCISKIRQQLEIDPMRHVPNYWLAAIPLWQRSSLTIAVVENIQTRGVNTRVKKGLIAAPCLERRVYGCTEENPSMRLLEGVELRHCTKRGGGQRGRNCWGDLKIQRCC